MSLDPTAARVPVPRALGLGGAFRFRKRSTLLKRKSGRSTSAGSGTARSTSDENEDTRGPVRSCDAERRRSLLPGACLENQKVGGSEEVQL